MAELITNLFESLRDSGDVEVLLGVTPGCLSAALAQRGIRLQKPGGGDELLRIVRFNSDACTVLGDNARGEIAERNGQQEWTSDAHGG
jgi:hypothetical protein